MSDDGGFIFDLVQPEINGTGAIRARCPKCQSTDTMMSATNDNSYELWSCGSCGELFQRG